MAGKKERESIWGTDSTDQETSKLQVHMGTLGIEHKHPHRVPHSEISTNDKSQTHLGEKRPLVHHPGYCCTLWQI